MEETLTFVAKLMAVAARTAPKTGGRDFVVTKVVAGEDLERLADGMIAHGRRAGKANWDRDAADVRQSEAVLLVSLKEPKVAGLNCGACGFDSCSNLEKEDVMEGPEFSGPYCAWRLVDLGIALGSAVKMASNLNVDNRIMYRAGVAARNLKITEGEIVIGVPLAATGKNIFFDRK